MKYLQNIEHGKVQKLQSIISYVDNEADIVTLIDDEHSKIAVQALDEGVAIKEHITSGDVMMYVIEGKVSALCDGENLIINPEEVLFIRKGIKLLETAIVKSKVLLVVVRGEQEELIRGVEFGKVSRIKDLVNSTVNDLTITNMNHIAVVLKSLDGFQTIERVNGSRDCLVYNLQGEADITVDDVTQHIDTDESIVISSNTMYNVETITQMKFLLIYAREKLTEVDY